MLLEDDLFNSAQPDGAGVREGQPLADRLRPTTLSDYIGQRHLLDSDKPLGGLLARGRIHSMILWGPPGTGKTTLARLLAEQAGCHWMEISAVLAGIRDIREAIALAQSRQAQGLQTVLFVDEVHRFNKAQQDAFLPHVESGLITFIGATTENPSFEVNSALLSRARVYVLKALDADDMCQVIERGTRCLERDIDPKAARALAEVADGDARRCLNCLEIAAQMVEGRIELETVTASLGERSRRFDRGGDLFYDQISALHKSIRGSSPDAALYWFCRMLDGGADPLYIGRRLIRVASEDIGNADPRALEIVGAAVSAYERLGSPEGELALAHAVLYLASVPKSDAAYQAFNRSMQYVKETGSHEVPHHLRNAPTALMRELGHGEGYRHAHREQAGGEAYAPGERYFPEPLCPEPFYEPKDAGLEIKIRERLERLKKLDKEARRTDT